MLRRITVSALAVLLAGCTTAAPTPAPTIALPVLVLPTMPPTPSAAPAPASPVPSPAPTAVPIQGMTTTQLNVRQEPSTASAGLGILPASSAVQVTARDASGNWYQVLYAQAPQGSGWVSSAYVQVPDRQAVPVLSGGGPSGAAIQQVNVRSGPGTSFNSLGTVNAGDTLTLIGRNADGTWLQVSFPSGPEGRGWVTTAYIKTDDASALPIIGGQGEVLGTGTPTGIPATPTATVQPAFDDADSAVSPGADLVLSPSTAGTVQFTSDLSAPSGDAQDWVRLTSSLPRLALKLECAGSAQLGVGLSSNGTVVQDWPGLNCGGQASITVDTGEPYLLHLQLVSAGGDLLYTRYTLFISALH
ncbi:MAG TPA: SH3 domain-containing protein [Anaerolineales bacterium]